MNWFHGYELARRERVARFAVWIVCGVLLVAFFRIQVLSSSAYRLRSELNRLRSMPVPAPRGVITDRNGRPRALPEKYRELFEATVGKADQVPR